MFERYTEKARRVIFFARYEASQFGSPYIETEHLLLGLLREDKALANRAEGRLSVNLQADGDLMYAPGVLWTAVHHRIPLLSVMHNNRAYHQEVMHIQRMANRHQRGITNAGIGTTLEDPNINYAMIARGMGVYAEGPISEPKDLGPALRRAADAVSRGEMALVDVVTQPR